jgi:hypothetical protein
MSSYSTLLHASELDVSVFNFFACIINVCITVITTSVIIIHIVNNHIIIIISCLQNSVQSVNHWLAASDVAASKDMVTLKLECLDHCKMNRVQSIFYARTVI